MKSNIEIISADIQDYPVIYNLARFYAYDISEYFGDQPGWEMEDDGLYGVGPDYKQYFGKSDAYPFLIRYNQQLAGFAIINKKGSEANIDFNMGFYAQPPPNFPFCIMLGFNQQ